MIVSCYYENKVASEILEGGAEGFSTFMSYYLLKVATKKDMAEALSVLEECYGAMLKLGATMFWENFNTDWVKNALPINEIPEN